MNRKNAEFWARQEFLGLSVVWGCSTGWKIKGYGFYFILEDGNIVFFFQMLPNTSLFYYFFSPSLKQAEVHLLYWFLFLWMLKLALQGWVWLFFCLWQGRKINVNKYQMDHGDIWQKKYEIHPGWTGRDFVRLWRATCRSNISVLWYIHAANMFRISLFAPAETVYDFWSMLLSEPSGFAESKTTSSCFSMSLPVCAEASQDKVSDWNSPVRLQVSWNWQERPGVHWVSLIGSLAATLL